VKAINRIKSSKKVCLLLGSLRELATTSMCSSNNVISTSPITCNPHCVTESSQSCPNSLPSAPSAYDAIRVKFAQWESAATTYTVKQKGKLVTKTKSKFDLVNKTSSLSAAHTQLESMTVSLGDHIYSAHRQWNAHKQICKNLDVDTVIIIEDYQ